MPCPNPKSSLPPPLAKEHLRRDLAGDRDSRTEALTLRIRLLALHQIDEYIRHIIQLAHALRIELSGSVVRQPNGVHRRIAERLRGHYLIKLPV